MSARTSVEEALALLEEHGPEARLLAGGHSLLPMMKLRLAKPEYVIDIDPLADALGYIAEHADRGPDRRDDAPQRAAGVADCSSAGCRSSSTPSA